MTKKDGKPCNKCGTSEWYKSGQCKVCQIKRSALYAKQNPERAAEKDRRYKERNREKLAEKSRIYFQENKQKVAPSRLRYQQNNRQQHNEYARLYRDRALTNGGKFTRDEWLDLCQKFGNKCLCCGRDDVKLASDHVIPISRGGSSNIDNIQCLCKSCNSSKGDKYIDYRPQKSYLNGES